MPSPFPGMDPYLEHPALWPDVHASLVAELRNTLAPVLRPRYSVRLEERVYFSEPDGLVFVGRPDLAIQDRARMAGPPTSTPAHSAPGAVIVEVPVVDTVRETYLEVRVAGGGEVVTVLEILSPANKIPGRGRALYEEKRQIVLAARTSLFRLPLRPGDDEPTVDIGAVLARLYDTAAYDLSIDYRVEPIPALQPDAAAWAAAVLRRAGLRS